MTFQINGGEPDFKKKPCLKPLVVRFKTGRIKATPKAVLLLAKYGFQKQELIARYRAGDWDEVPIVQSRRNELALKDALKVLAWYRLVQPTWLESVPYPQRKHLPTVWIETSEANSLGVRNKTTIFCFDDL